MLAAQKNKVVPFVIAAAVAIGVMTGLPAHATTPASSTLQLDRTSVEVGLPITATVTLKDADGQIVTDGDSSKLALVVEPLPAGLHVSDWTANTDGTFSAVITSTVAGDYNVSVTYDGAVFGSPTPIAFTAPQLGFDQASLALSSNTITSSGGGCAPSTYGTITATVTVTNSLGVPQSGQDVTFSTDGDIYIVDASSTVQTDENGLASVTISTHSVPASPSTGHVYATFNGGGTVTNSGAQVTVIGNLIDMNWHTDSTLTVTPTAGPGSLVVANGSDSYTATVTVLDQCGKPATVDVVFTTTNGASPASTTVSAVNGSATITITSHTPGTSDVTVSLPNAINPTPTVGSPKTIGFSGPVSVPPDAANSTITIDSPTIVATGSATSTPPGGTHVITIVIRDQSGSPILDDYTPDITVNMPAGMTGSGLSFDPATGKYTESLWSTTAGALAVTADLFGVRIGSGQSDGGTVNANYGSQPMYLGATLTLSSNTIHSSGGGCPPPTYGTITATVTVEDSSGVPHSGQHITFSTDGDIYIVDVPPIAITDENGQASVTISTHSVPASPSTGHVYATWGGGGTVDNSGAAVTVIGKLVYMDWHTDSTLTVTPTAGAGATVLANGSDSYTATVTATDQCGKAASVNVTFTTTNSASPASTTVPTVNGVATITIMSNTPGDSTVTVSLPATATPTPTVGSPTTITFTALPDKAQMMPISNLTGSLGPCPGDETIGTTTASVQVTTATGVPIAGRSVTFTVDSPLTIVGPATVDTDQQGVAQVTISYLHGTTSLNGAKVYATVDGVDQVTGSPRSPVLMIAIADPALAYYPTLTVTPTKGSTPVYAGGADSWTATLHVEKACSVPAAGLDIQFTVGGTAVPSPATQTTDQDGNATITITDANPETVDVTTAILNPGYYTVEKTTGSPAPITFMAQIHVVTTKATLALSSDKINSSGGGCPAPTFGTITATVTVQDSDGVLIANRNVTFSTDGELYIVDASPTVKTDANGQATVTISTHAVPASPLTGHVYAAVEGILTVENNGAPVTVFGLLLQYPEARVDSTLTVTPTAGAGATVYANGSDSYTATVTATNECGRPATVPVTFLTDNGASPASTTVTTVNGVATVTITSNAPGDAHVTISLPAYSNPTTTVGSPKTITFTGPPSTVTAWFESISPLTGTVGPCPGDETIGTAVARVFVSDTSSNVQSQTVTFTVDPPLTIVGPSAVDTDENGIAQVTISYLPGTTSLNGAKVYATVEGVTQVTDSPKAPVFMIADIAPVMAYYPTLTVTPTSGAVPVYAGGTDSWTATLHVDKACSAPAQGVDIQFTVGGTAVPSPATQTTDKDGNATITITDANPETVDVTTTILNPGLYTVEKTAGSPAPITFKKLPDKAQMLPISPIHDSSGACPADIVTGSTTAQVKVTDAGGTPIAGRTVTFTVDSPLTIVGASTVNTGPNGVAQVTISHQPGTVSLGGAKVYAVVDGVDQVTDSPRVPVLNITFIEDADLFYPNLTVAPTKGTGPVYSDGSDSWTVTVHVVDGCGATAPTGKDLVFSAGGTAQPSPQTLKTDTDGNASFTVTDANPETVDVIVTIPGGNPYTVPGSTSNSVKVTFTAPPPTSISAATVNAGGPYVFTGSAQTPSVTVTLGGKTLVAGTDYTAAYSNNTNVGQATVTVTGIGNYTGTATGHFTITPKVVTLSVDPIADMQATGSPITPPVVVRDGTNPLVLNTDYTVSYANNTDPGTANVTVTGIGNYAGSTGTATFKITTVPQTAQPQTLTFTPASVTKTYGDAPFTNGLTRTGTGALTYSSSNPSVATVDPSSGQVTIVGAGSANISVVAAAVPNVWLAASKSYALTVAPRSLATATVDAGAAQTYTGGALTPPVTVTLDGKTLVAGTDYTAAYSANTNTGQATVTVTGIGNYKDSATGHFTINPPKSSAKTIDAFTVPGQSGLTVIGTNTIAITMPYGSAVTALTPSLTAAAKATVSPASGVVQDFTHPVVYTVTAEDGTTATYTVTVTVNQTPPTVQGLIDAVNALPNPVKTWADADKVAQAANLLAALTTTQRALVPQSTSDKLTLAETQSGPVNLVDTTGHGSVTGGVAVNWSVRLIVTPIPSSDARWPSMNSLVSAGKKLLALYDIRLIDTLTGQTVQPPNAGSLTVGLTSVPLNGATAVDVIHMNADNTSTRLSATAGGTNVSFTTPSFSLFGIEGKPAATSSGGTSGGVTVTTGGHTMPWSPLPLVACLMMIVAGAYLGLRVRRLV